MENSQYNLCSGLATSGKTLFWVVIAFILIQQSRSSYWTEGAL
jgi:hypothetical protein